MQRHGGQVVAYEISGHAGYAEKGRDTVCAAASALGQAAIIGLEEYLGLQPQVEVSPGRLRCQLDPVEAKDPRVQAIVETMILGLRGVEKGQPGRLTFQETEV